MHLPNRTKLNASRRGSVLGISMVIAVAITIVLAGLMKWSNTERAINLDYQLSTKAAYGADSTAEFALAQMVARLRSEPVITTNQFRTGDDMPVLPSTDLLSSTLSDILDSLSGDSGLVGAVLDELESLVGGLLGGGGEEDDEEEEEDEDEYGEEPAEEEVFTVTPLAINVGSFSAESTLFIDPTNRLYADDPLRGQRVRMRTVRVLAAAKAEHRTGNSGATAYCEYILQVRDTPLFGYMAFYNMDLEISPGPHMELYGPVHSNGNVYVSSGDSIEFHGVVTSAGGIYHSRAPNSGMSVSSGSVSFLGPDGDQVEMLQGGAWLDSSSSGWTTQAYNLWDGNVLSEDHGITEILPPATPPYVPDDPSTPDDELVNDAHDAIEPALPTNDEDFKGFEIESQRYASKACLVIEVDHNNSGGVWSMSARAYKYTPDESGKYVRETGSGYGTFRRTELSLPPGLVQHGSFYDAREARTVRAADINIGVLKSAIEDDAAAASFTNGGATFAPGSEWNGVVYIEHRDPSINASNLGGVRLINGSSLPNRPTSANNFARGMTVATNAPVYIQGNYNADGNVPTGSGIKAPETNEPPAAVAADAVTILSSAWDDADSSTGLSQRVATQTEVAAAIHTGIVPTNKSGNGTFSGGIENLVRFLEDWNGVKLGLRTSQGVMFESEIAKGPWGSPNTYRPPIRVWGFNDLFAQGVQPPGTPGVRTYRRIGYRRLTLPEYESALLEINGS